MHTQTKVDNKKKPNPTVDSAFHIFRSDYLNTTKRRDVLPFPVISVMR
jgi:hypothetical protein